jgi:hypothetical protein
MRVGWIHNALKSSLKNILRHCLLANVNKRLEVAKKSQKIYKKSSQKRLKV